MLGFFFLIRKHIINNRLLFRAHSFPFYWLIIILNEYIWQLTSNFLSQRFIFKVVLFELYIRTNVIIYSDLDNVP